MTCMKQEFCIHEKYCQRHIGQNFDSCILFSRNSKPMTNEEYLKSCDTEQLAEAIYYLTWFHTELDESLDKNVKNGCYNDDENIKIVMEWLKQPHTKE